MAHLWLQVSVDVSQLVQLAHADEHLADVESCDLLLEHAGVVEQCPEGAARDVLHGEVDVLGVLEGIQQTDEPRRLRRSEDVALDEDVADLADDGGGNGRENGESTGDAPRPS